MKSLAVVAASLPFIAAQGVQSSVKAEAACRYLSGDAAWPSESDWKTQLPKAIKQGPSKKGLLHPDYRLDVKTVDDVIAAVKFAGLHNIRLSAIHSGHDGLGRNDAPSGLLLGLQNLGGLRVEQTFTPTAQGQPKVGGAVSAAAPASGMAGMAGMAGMNMKRSPHGPESAKAKGATPAKATPPSLPPKAGTTPPANPMAGMNMKRSPHGPDGDSAYDAPKAAPPPKVATPPPAPAAPASGKTPYAVTIGAGLTTQDLNDKIAAQGIFTIGAEHGEVGVAGGFTQCGGHGPMTSAYGLGSDNVLEYQVVTADGQLKIANEVANPDLFWALRGGCGATFGIVTQATVRAYPSPKFTVTKFTYNGTDENGFFDSLAYLHSEMPSLSDKGVQGYYVIFPKKFSASFHTVGSLATADASKKIWEPVLSKIASYSGINKASTIAEYLDYPNYKTYYDATWGPAEGGNKKRDVADDELILDWWNGEYVKRSERNSLRKRHSPGESVSLPVSMGKTPGDGRLLDKESLKSPKLSAAFKSAMPTKGMMRGALIGGGIVVKKSTTETSVHPSWRKTYVTFWSDKDVDELSNLAKGMGAYINEASWNATNWQDTFWGSNYPKLSSLKTKYDPNFVFYATPGINADEITVNAKGALCRVQAGAQTKSLYPPVGDNLNMKGASRSG